MANATTTGATKLDPVFAAYTRFSLYPDIDEADVEPVKPVDWRIHHLKHDLSTPSSSELKSSLPQPISSVPTLVCAHPPPPPPPPRPSLSINTHSAQFISLIQSEKAQLASSYRTSLKNLEVRFEKKKNRLEREFKKIKKWHGELRMELESIKNALGCVGLEWVWEAGDIVFKDDSGIPEAMKKWAGQEGNVVRDLGTFFGLLRDMMDSKDVQRPQVQGLECDASGSLPTPPPSTFPDSSSNANNGTKAFKRTKEFSKVEVLITTKPMDHFRRVQKQPSIPKIKLVLKRGDKGSNLPPHPHLSNSDSSSTKRKGSNPLDAPINTRPGELHGKSSQLSHDSGLPLTTPTTNPSSSLRFRLPPLPLPSSRLNGSKHLAVDSLNLDSSLMAIPRSKLPGLGRIKSKKKKHKNATTTAPTDHSIQSTSVQLGEPKDGHPLAPVVLAVSAESSSMHLSSISTSASSPSSSTFKESSASTSMVIPPSPLSTSTSTPTRGTPLPTTSASNYTGLDKNPGVIRHFKRVLTNLHIGMASSPISSAQVQNAEPRIGSRAGMVEPTLDLPDLERGKEEEGEEEDELALIGSSSSLQPPGSEPLRTPTPAPSSTSRLNLSVEANPPARGHIEAPEIELEARRDVAVSSLVVASSLTPTSTSTLLDTIIVRHSSPRKRPAPSTTTTTSPTITFAATVAEAQVRPSPSKRAKVQR